MTLGSSALSPTNRRIQFVESRHFSSCLLERPNIRRAVGATLFSQSSDVPAPSRAVLMEWNTSLDHTGSPPESCSKVPLLAAAWKQLPPELRFPCDSRHLIVISDCKIFLESHPEIAG